MLGMAIGAAAMIGGSILSSRAQSKAAKKQEKAAQKAARASEDYEEWSRDIRLDQLANVVEKRLGTIRATYAAKGVVSDKGSAREAQLYTARQADIDKQIIKKESQLKQKMIRLGVPNVDTGSIWKSNMIQTGTTLLTSQASSNWFDSLLKGSSGVSSVPSTGMSGSGWSDARL